MADISIPQTSKEIVEVPIDQLKPFPGNPRVWDDVDERQLTESIQEFGMLLPLVVNCAKGQENLVVGGNFRLAIYKKLGVQMVPVVFVNIEDETKERELNLRLNRNQGNWDWDLLKNYATEELIKVGFDEIDLGKYWDNELSVEDDHFDIQKVVEEVQKNPIAKVGDLFGLGSHRVICGDCTDLAVVTKLVDKDSVSYVNSDPPFNIGLNYASGVGGGSTYGGNEKDKRSDEEYKQLLKSSIENALAVAKPDCHVFYWCDEKYVWLLQMLYKELGIDSKRLCFWIKNNQNVTPKVAFNKMVECCVYGVRGKPYLNETLHNLNEIQNKEIATGNRAADDIYDLLNIWLVNRLPAGEYQHPTMKSQPSTKKLSGGVHRLVIMSLTRLPAVAANLSLVSN